jgi:predicted transcriptional regulator
VTQNQLTALERALRLLGPLEGRIMREVWTLAVPDPFVVRDVQKRMPELAHTTVMTTLNRLAEKRLLTVQHVSRQRAHVYGIAANPEEYVVRTSREQVEHVVERFGDAAVAAFAEHLNGLSPERLKRLKELGRR